MWWKMTVTLTATNFTVSTSSFSTYFRIEACIVLFKWRLNTVKVWGCVSPASQWAHLRTDTNNCSLGLNYVGQSGMKDRAPITNCVWIATPLTRSLLWPHAAITDSVLTDVTQAESPARKTDIRGGPAVSELEKWAKGSPLKLKKVWQEQCSNEGWERMADCTSENKSAGLEPASLDPRDPGLSYLSSTQGGSVLGQTQFLSTGEVPHVIRDLTEVYSSAFIIQWSVSVLQAQCKMLSYVGYSVSLKMSD